VNLTVQRAIDPALVPAFYEMYAAAFDPVRTRAAARHLLTAREFAEEMADKRIEKYVVWDDSGEPLALTTFTNDLAAVAWISPDFYTARYPEHHARGTLFYLGYTLVRPRRATHRVFKVMMDRIIERLTEARAVCVFDVSAYNDSRAVGRLVASLPAGRRAQVEAVDVQTYYGVTFGAATDCGAAG
jgi:hypothetical protein